MSQEPKGPEFFWLDESSQSHRGQVVEFVCVVDLSEGYRSTRVGVLARDLDISQEEARVLIFVPSENLQWFIKTEFDRIPPPQYHGQPYRGPCNLHQLPPDHKWAPIPHEKRINYRPFQPKRWGWVRLLLQVFRAWGQCKQSG